LDGEQGGAPRQGAAQGGELQHRSGTQQVQVLIDRAAGLDLQWNRIAR
jgi:hypothetical protein